jgi:cbb3-type cytochrome oxidase maturation protein
MRALAWLVPTALLMGGIGLAAFLWALRSGQFDDLDGAAYRILEDDHEEPSPPVKKSKNATDNEVDEKAEDQKS